MNKLQEFYKKYKDKYIGNIQYIVTIINVSSQVQKHNFVSLGKLSEFVDEINNETYWMVQKIEKIRIFDFKYAKNITHSPLWFQHDAVTEVYNLNDTDYQFLKIDDSLIHVIRKNNI